MQTLGRILKKHDPENKWKVDFPRAALIALVCIKQRSIDSQSLQSLRKRNNVVRSPFRKCSLFLKCSITLAGWGHGLLMGARIDVFGETCDANFPPGGRVAFPGKNWRNAATRRARKGWRPPDRRRLHYHLLDRPLDPSTSPFLCRPGIRETFARRKCS